MSISKKIVLFSGLILILNGCGGSSGGDSEKTQLADIQPSSQNENKPPIVYVGEDIKVQVNKPVTIYAT